MPIKVPGQLVNSSSKFPLVNAKDNQLAGLGFFTSTSQRDNLPGPKRTPSFVAVMSLSSEDYLCQFIGDLNTVGDWELDRNWSRIANEANASSLLTTGAIRYNEVGESIGGFTNLVVGDFNQDGVVNIDDFLSFFVSYVNTSATSSRTSNASEDRVSGHIGNTGAHLATWEFENYDGTNDFMLATTKAIDEQVDSKINTKDLFATNRTLSSNVAHTLSAGLTFRDSNSQGLFALGVGLVQIGGITYPLADGTANQVLSTNGSGVLAFRTVTDGADGADGADGTDGTGFTGGSYDSATGVVTFTSDDGLGFSTGDLRGADGADGTDGANGTDGADGQGVPTGGTEGQVLIKSSGTDYDTEWDYVEATYLQVENAETTALASGTVVYAFGASGSSITVKKSDASASSTMPAIGIVLEDISSGATGEIITSGVLNKTISGLSSVSVGDTVYVSETAGEVTTTKPTGTALIQNIGTVLQTNGSNIQKMKVSSIDRANDVPNIPNGQAWIGNASGVATPTTLATVATSGAYSDITGTPSLAAVATSGSASDLSAGTLAVSRGGTGASSLSSNGVLTGNGTSAVTAESNLAFDGSTLTITGARQIGSTTASGQFYGDTVAFGSGPSGVDGNIEQGKLYYLDSSQQWEETDANAAASATGMLALATIDDNARFLVKGFARHSSFAGFTTGDVLYVSGTAAGITKTAPTGSGDIVRIVGYCTDGGNREIYFDPSKDWVELS